MRTSKPKRFVLSPFSSCYQHFMKCPTSIYISGIFQETLKKADEIFGQENKDLYAIFEGLITRNVH